MRKVNIEECIQEHWRQGEAPLIEALTFADGRIVLFRSATHSRGGSITSSIEWLGDTTLEKVIEAQEPDLWFYVEPLCNIVVEQDDVCYLAGGGAMGNEGFIAAQQHSSGALLWVACFNHSNPFDSVQVAGAMLQVTNNRDEVWTIDLHNPSCITVQSG